MKFAIAMAKAGQAVWWSIGFQFLRLYHFLFRRISHGATRLQEILADRAAARLYGPLHFEEGLRHVVRRQFEFKDIAEREIEEALRAGRALQNIYALEIPAGRSFEVTLDQAINRPTSEDDTHPSPADRFPTGEWCSLRNSTGSLRSLMGSFRQSRRHRARNESEG